MICEKKEINKRVSENSVKRETIKKKTGSEKPDIQACHICMRVGERTGSSMMMIKVETQSGIIWGGDKCGMQTRPKEVAYAIGLRPRLNICVLSANRLKGQGQGSTDGFAQ